jgi:hypothetical protein
VKTRKLSGGSLFRKSIPEKVSFLKASLPHEKYCYVLMVQKKLLRIKESSPGP